jgi:hypothetical protein
MFSFLHHNAKKRLIKEYRIRVATIITMMVGLSLLVLIFIIGFAHTVFSVREAFQIDTIIVEIKAKKIEEMVAVMRHETELAEKIINQDNTHTPTRLIQLVQSILSSEVAVTRYKFQTLDGEIKFIIEGSGNEIEELFKFQEGLRAQKDYFSDVILTEIQTDDSDVKNFSIITSVALNNYYDASI